MDDSTFQAYLKNPKFLSTILPLSPELDSILRRVFECDPRKRVTIPELKSLILRCPRFTTRSDAAPPTPPPEEETISPHDSIPETTSCAPSDRPYDELLLPSMLPLPALFDNQNTSLSRSNDGSCSSDDGSMFSSDSSCSTGSSRIDSPTYYDTARPQYVPATPPVNYYGTFFPLDSTPKHLVDQLSTSVIPVY